jgi:hypothetical protein
MSRRALESTTLHQRRLVGYSFGVVIPVMSDLGSSASMLEEGRQFPLKTMGVVVVVFISTLRSSPEPTQYLQRLLYQQCYLLVSSHLV